MKHGRRDSASTILGPLCARRHDHEGTGMSRRFRSGHCYECMKETRAARYAENPEKYRSKDRAYTEENKRRLSAARRANYAANRERIRAAARARLDRDRERARQRAVKAAARKSGAYRRYAKDYYRRNSIRIALRNRVYKALRVLGNGKKHCLAKYGINLRAIQERLGACPGARKDWHIDHIRPLALFDLSKPDEVARAFAPSNHQWLPAIENMQKGARYAPR